MVQDEYIFASEKFKPNTTRYRKRISADTIVVDESGNNEKSANNGSISRVVLCLTAASVIAILMVLAFFMVPKSWRQGIFTKYLNDDSTMSATQGDQHLTDVNNTEIDYADVNDANLDHTDVNDAEPNYTEHDVQTSESESDLSESDLGEDSEQLSGPFTFDWRPYIISPYGQRIHPVTGENDTHMGIDIGVPVGTEIHSIQDGKVTFAGEIGEYGYVVIIDDGNRLISKYGRCNEILVSTGQMVKTGDVIAKSGNSGASIQPHLHLEIIKDGQYLDPHDFMDTIPDSHDFMETAPDPQFIMENTVEQEEF